MWKTDCFTFILICLMGVSCVVAASPESEASSPGEGPSPVLHFPAISPQEETFLEKCILNATRACLEQLLVAAFRNQALPEKCCGELLNMGEDCDKHFITYVLSIPEIMSHVDEEKVRAHAHDVWSRCQMIILPQ
uniref:Prolamin-like domain-containing protein n=1 Tax=Kalanchoe fedtschenkoi TaxID=63787 RepID=A0A7N0U5C6_KALFE